MKAPVQEYAVILSQRVKDLPWGQVADAATVARAQRNLARDVAGVGVLARPEAFAVLLALELSWDPSSLPCFGVVNRGAAVAAASADRGHHVNNGAHGRRLADGIRSNVAHAVDGHSKKPEGRRYGWEDLTKEQQALVTERMVAESQVYTFAAALALEQEGRHPHHAPLVAAFLARCDDASEARITNMRGLYTRKPSGASGASCAPFVGARSAVL